MGKSRLSSPNHNMVGLKLQFTEYNQFAIYRQPYDVSLAKLDPLDDRSSPKLPVPSPAILVTPLRQRYSSIHSLRYRIQPEARIRRHAQPFPYIIRFAVRSLTRITDHCCFIPVLIVDSRRAVARLVWHPPPRTRPIVPQRGRTSPLSCSLPHQKAYRPRARPGRR